MREALCGVFGGLGIDAPAEVTEAFRMAAGRRLITAPYRLSAGGVLCSGGVRVCMFGASASTQERLKSAAFTVFLQ